MVEFCQILFEMHFKFVLIFRNNNFIAVIIFNQFVRLPTKYHLEFVNNIQVTFTSVFFFFNTAMKTYIYLFHIEMVKNIKCFFNTTMKICIYILTKR